MSAPLLFQPSPDAVYGFPHARLVARVDSPYQRIDALKHYDPDMHAGLFSASRSVRDKLSQFLKPSG